MTGEIITEPIEITAESHFLQRTMLKMNSIISAAQSRKMGPIWISLVMIASVTWTIWNVENFQTAMQINTAGIHQQLRLESEIQQLSERWKNTSNSALEEKLKLAEVQIFENYQALAEWLYLLTKKSKHDGLSLKYKLGIETEVESLNDIISIPIEIEVLAYNKLNAYIIYQQLLDFTQRLISEPWHQKLEQAGIENEGNNKAKLSLLINISMWKPESFSPQRSSLSDISEISSDPSPVEMP